MRIMGSSRAERGCYHQLAPFLPKRREPKREKPCASILGFLPKDGRGRADGQAFYHHSPPHLSVKTNMSYVTLSSLELYVTHRFSIKKVSARHQQGIPVSHTVHPRNPPLVPTTCPRLFLLTWWA